ncbi:MAG: oligosaccharide flippase family protein [Erysipelotrichaceae bacterium]
MKNNDLIKNTISAIVLQIVLAISGLIVPQLLIRSFGSTSNGMVSSIQQFITYLGLVEAGVGSASIVQLYKPLLEKKFNEVNSILAATKIFYMKSGFLYMFLVLGLLFIYPMFVSNQVDSWTVTWMILIVSMSGIGDYFILGKYRVLLTADQKYYVITFIQSLGTIVNIGLTIILVNLNQSILVVKFFATLVYVSRIIFVYLYVRKKYPYLNMKVKPDFSKLDQKWDALIHQVAGMVVLNTDIGLLTIFRYPLTTISVYTVYNMILGIVFSFLNALLNAITPTFGTILVQENQKKSNDYFSLYEFFYFILMFTLFICIFILIMPFVSLYTNGITDVNYLRQDVAFIFIILGIMYMIRTPALTIINAAGHYKQTKNGAIIESIINIVVSLSLIGHYGIVGVLLGTVCSHCFRSTELIIYNAKHIIFNSLFLTVKRIIRNVLISIVCIFIIFQFNFSVESYSSWTIYAVFVFVTSSIILLAINFICEKNMVLSLKELRNRNKNMGKEKEGN